MSKVSLPNCLNQLGVGRVFDAPSFTFFKVKSGCYSVITADHLRCPTRPSRFDLQVRCRLFTKLVPSLLASFRLKVRGVFGEHRRLLNLHTFCFTVIVKLFSKNAQLPLKKASLRVFRRYTMLFLGMKKQGFKKRK